VFVFFLFICARNFVQENYRGGIVYGPKAAFNIGAPEGWVLDNQAGRDQGLPCVLYSERLLVVGREDGNVRKNASTQFEDVNAFVIRGKGEQGHAGDAWHAEREDSLRQDRRRP
jgi:hypothetical protein